MKTSNARSHKYKHGGRVFNPYTFVFSTLVLVIWMISEVNHYDDTYMRDPNTRSVFLAPVIVDHPEDESIETKIRKYFPRSHVTMIAIAHAESGMNHNATGYNCYYKDGVATTTKIIGGSRACKVEDRHLAWSVDCGVLQKNYVGRKTCPKIPLDQHLKEVAELSKVQGLQAWTSFNDNKHLQYLSKNK